MKRELLQKIQKYKTLFPDETKNIRMKPNASEQELLLQIDEIENKINTSSFDQFCTESVLHCLGLIEGVSARIPRYDITGMTEALKANPQFHKLCKLCFVKYGSFFNCPPEVQLLFLVSSTAYFCNARNRQKAQMDFYLNQPAD